MASRGYKNLRHSNLELRELEWEYDDAELNYFEIGFVFHLGWLWEVVQLTRGGGKG